jgi:phage terminase large subunit
MAAKKEVAFEYIPREQFMPLHQRIERWACMVCHRRAGKTVAAIHELVLRGLYTKKKNARYAYVAPFFRQAKDVAWVYLKEATKTFAVRIRESALRVELPNGAWITLYGADNPDSLRGIYLDGVVLDEYGDSRPSLWGTVILPTLADRKGWAIFIGTPKGKNHFYEIHKRSQEETGWYSLTLKASESGIVDAEELLEMKAQMTDEAYDQEMECSFTAAIIGTYYASMIEKMELNKQISKGVCVYDRSMPVKVAMDLGRTDNTAAWFWQETPNGINIIDYYEAQGKVLDHYIAMLNAKGYNYEEVWLPHDAVAKTLATKRSTIEQMLEAGFPCRKVPKLEVQHGIDAARKVLPHCVIEQESCFAGIEALRAYRRSYNELLKQYNDKPLHDWSSDGADAFRYLALVCKERVRNEVPENFRKKEEGAGVHEFSLNDLFKERETFKRDKILRI